MIPAPSATDRAAKISRTVAEDDRAVALHHEDQAALTAKVRMFVSELSA